MSSYFNWITVSVRRLRSPAYLIGSFFNLSLFYRTFIPSFKCNAVVSSLFSPSAVCVPCSCPIPPLSPSHALPLCLHFSLLLSSSSFSRLFFQSSYILQLSAVSSSSSSSPQLYPLCLTPPPSPRVPLVFPLLENIPNVLLNMVNS